MSDANQSVDKSVESATGGASPPDSHGGTDDLSRAVAGIGEVASKAHALAAGAASDADKALSGMSGVLDRVGTIETKVEELVGGGGQLLQDVVNFLHWAFPGHANLPGVAAPAHPVLPSQG